MPAKLHLVQSTTFRLATLYLVLFAVSVSTLLAYVYWNTAVLIERQADETIRAEIQALADQYRLRRLGGIIDIIQRRSREETGSIYLLIAPDATVIAGNIDKLPAEAVSETGWIEFPVDARRGGSVERHMARAFHTELAGGYELVVGRDVEGVRQFGEVIRRTIYGTLGIALILGLGGGLLISRNFLRRVEAITGASRSIMGGNLHDRMPVSGSGDELDQLSLSLNEMLEQIERLMNGMKEVSSNLAHDLKTPLTRIKARVEAALRGNTAADYREALEKTVEESDRLLHTFNSLLSIARAESGQSRGGFEPIDAGTILDDVAELYEPIAEEQGGSLTVVKAPGLGVHADRQLLAQAVSNLVDNALKYGAAEGEVPQVTMSGEAVEGKVAITVADRGPGIPEADRARVIERFVRLDQSRSKPGNGLGLSLVSGVMKLHGGELRLEDNQPGLRATLLLRGAPVAG